MDAQPLLLAFGFVSPWILVGGLALSAVPLVIHLLRRRQFVDRPWAAMQFLQAALRTQARRVRFESVVLLAVRTLQIGLAATAVAQPFLEADEALSRQAAGRLRLLVIDASLSMRARLERQSAFEQAQTEAARIVGAASAGDSFALVRICRTPPLAVIQRPADDRSAVLEQIRSLSATSERGDVAGALRAAQTCLRTRLATTRAEVVILSDFQAQNWAPALPRERQEIAALLAELADVADLTCVHTAPPATANLALTRIEPVLGAPPGIDVAAVDVSVLNASDQPALDVPVEVFAGDRLVGRALLDAPAGETAVTQISVSSLSPADSSIVAQLPDDGLLDDNRRWGVLPDQDALDVLLVSGRPRTADRRGAADFVRLALTPSESPGSPAAVTTSHINPGELGRTDLTRFDCVYLCNVGPLDDAGRERLRNYVRAGGGLVIAPGDQSQPPEGQSPQRTLDDVLAPVVLIETVGSDDGSAPAVRLAPGDYRHPVIRPFAGNPDAGLLTTEIDRYWRVRLPESVSAEVVLAYSSGDPAILEFRPGAGRVLLVTTPLDESWSKWPLWPSFVPIVHELTRAAAAPAADHAHVVGDSLVLQLPPDDFAVAVQHRSPAGHVSDVSKSHQPDGTSTATVVADAPGVHLLRLGPPRDAARRFAVNVDPAESRLDALDRDELQALMPDRPLRFLAAWQPDAAEVHLSPKAGLSRRLLLGVLGLLVVEQLMSWRFRVGAAALGLLVVAVLTASIQGPGHMAAIGLAATLLGALLATLAVRNRLRRSRNAESHF